MSLKRARGIGQEEDVDWNEMLNWATNFYIYMCPEEVQECLDNGAYVDTRNENSQETPLHRACLYGFRCVATVLMENGADVNAKNRDGKTPLHHASFPDALGSGSNIWKLEIAKKLIESGAKVNIKDNKGETPLYKYCAGSNGCFGSGMVQMLLSHGADVNAKAKDGSTPLQIAAKRHHKDMVMYILRQFPEILVE